jgi:glycosyltransferase involved in cell wall biosynthesis
MKAAVAALVDQEQFDLVQIDGIHMAACVPVLRRGSRAPIVYDWHGIESQAMRHYGARVKSPIRKLHAAVAARRLAALEARTLRQGFGHLVCCEQDRAELHRVAPDARIVVIENGVDTRFFEDRTGFSSSRYRIVFVGSMSYHANVEAAVSFARGVWPLIRERFPLWRLTMVGCDPAPAVRALGNEQNVEVTGTVADVRPYYREALAAIAPLRTGGGPRLKILEAMAAGVPVVSTTLGAEGLAVSPDVSILIADRDEDWLPRLAALSCQRDFWNSLASAGWELVRSRYDWEVLGKSLWETYCGWLDLAQR